MLWTFPSRSGSPVANESIFPSSMYLSKYLLFYIFSQRKVAFLCRSSYKILLRQHNNPYPVQLNLPGTLVWFTVFYVIYHCNRLIRTSTKKQNLRLLHSRNCFHKFYIHYGLKCLKLNSITVQQRCYGKTFLQCHFQYTRIMS